MTQNHTKSTLSCPSSLIIPYNAPFATTTRTLEITNNSSAPIRVLVKLAEDVRRERAGAASSDTPLQTTQKPPFSISYTPQQLFSNQSLKVNVTYQSGRDLDVIEEVMLRIMSASEVRLVQIRAVPVVTMRQGSASTPRRASTSRLGSKRASLSTARGGTLTKPSKTTLNFPNVPLNTTATKSFSLVKYINALAENGLPRGTQWRVRYREPRERGVWKVHPKEGTLDGEVSDDALKVHVDFTPVQERTSHQDIVVEFQYVDVLSGENVKQVVPVSLVGTGIEEPVLAQQSSGTVLLGGTAQNFATTAGARASFSATQEAAADITSAHALHQKLAIEQNLSNYTLKSTTNQIKIHERIQNELAEPQDDTSRSKRSTKKRTQRVVSDTITTQTLKSPHNRRTTTLLDRKNKEAELMRKAAQFHEHEKMKEIKWFKEVGSQPPSKEEQEVIKAERKLQRELQALRERELNRERKTNDTSIGKPVVQQDIKQTFIEESAARVKRQQEAAQRATQPPPVVEEEPAPIDTKAAKKAPAKAAPAKKGAKAAAEPPPPEPVVEETAPSQPAVPPEQLEKDQLNQQLTEEFVRFANVVLLRERVKRRLEFISQRTEEQNIQLALQEANIPRVDTQLMKIRKLPVPPVSDAGADAPLPDGLDSVTMPQFKDFSFVNLKVPLDYKIKAYEVEKMLPLNTYMPPEEVLDYQDVFNVPFPVQHEFDMNPPAAQATQGGKGAPPPVNPSTAPQSEEQRHKALLSVMTKCNETFTNQPLENANYVDPAHFSALVAFSQRVPAENDPAFEILSQNKRTLIEAYDRLKEKEVLGDVGSAEEGATTRRARVSPQEQVVFSTFSSQFDAQDVNISDPMPLHAAVKKRNLPLKAYAKGDLMGLPALRPFTINMDASQIAIPSEESDNAPTTQEEQSATPSHNFASVLANYSLMHLYSDLAQHIEGPPEDATPAKDAKAPKGKGKAAVVEEPVVPKDVKVTLSDEEMQAMMIAQMSPSIQVASVELNE